MGFKAATIFVSERDPGYFGTLPAHDSEKAKHLARALSLPFISSEVEVFEFALWPENNTFALGAYDGAMVLGDRAALDTCSSELNNPLVRRTLELFPSATTLCFTLHSVVNHWGYALYERGKLVRRFVGDADSGITHDFGELQPEEKVIFERSRKDKNGDLIFEMEINGEMEEFSVDQVGENLVFSLASRFLGQPLDSSSPVDIDGLLKLELFTKVRTVTEPSTFPARVAKAPPTKVGTGAKPWWRIW